MDNLSMRNFIRAVRPCGRPGPDCSGSLWHPPRAGWELEKSGQNYDDNGRGVCAMRQLRESTGQAVWACRS